MNRFFLAGLAVIAVVGAVPWLRLGRDPAAPPQSAPAADDKRPHVEVAPPQRKTIHRKLRLPGDVRPNQEVGVYARVPGYVESAPVDRGAWVNVADLLVKIAVPELEAQFRKEKAERDWRKTAWERLEGIAKKSPNLINRDLLDDAKGRYDMAEAQVGLTETMIRFASIRAPFAGLVSERWVDPGHLVQQGNPRILHLLQVETVRVRVHVPQADVPDVRADALAEIAVDELPGRKFQAKVARSFWALNRETKTMAVEIDIKNDHADRSQWVRPGMFARVTLDLDPRKDVLVLPASALIIEKKNAFVFVVKDGVAKKTKVEVGLDNGIEFEVKSGVTEADDVVVAGKNLIADGEKVRVARK